MSFAEQTIIELKESESIINNTKTDIHGNISKEGGNYEIILQNGGVNLNDGDEISIKSLYVDSVASSSDKIVIEKDTQITVGCVNYVQNIDTDNKNYNTNINPTIPPTQPDGKAYFACVKAQVLDRPNTLLIGQMKIYRQKSGPWGRNGLNLKIVYTNLNGGLANINLPIPFNTGTSAFYEYNSKTHPSTFPFYVKGTVATVSTDIQTWQHTIFQPGDNVDTGAIQRTSETGNNAFLSNLADGTSFKELTGIVYKSEVNDFDKSFGGTPINFTYLDWETGLRETKQVTLPQKSNARDDTPATATGAVNGFGGQFFCGTTDRGDGEFVVNSPDIVTLRDTFNVQGLNFESLVLGDVDFTQTLSYKENEVAVTLPAGNYELGEICEKLTDLFTNIQVGGETNFATYPVNSPFLHTNNQLKELNNITGADVQYYCSEDGDDFFFYTNGTQDKWIGSDQFGIVGDPVLNKAKFVSIHANLYDSSPSIITKFIKHGATDNFSLQGRNGGIVLTTLEPQAFWEKLGFDFSEEFNITTKPQSTTADIGANKFHLQGISTEIGRFTTSSISGLSNAIIKKSFANFDGMGSMTQPNTTSASFEILAKNDISNGKDNNGYFLIEIDGIPSTNLIGSNYQNTRIQSIVSRFYSTNSFTSAYNEGSISTVYRGPGTVLSRFRVRILDPNRNVSPDLGTNSCVFLEITRGQPNQKS